ncbi:MAG: UDP-N-acetylmuramoyl-tripeptide--D-alanyl-D-alanine ligase [Candidatus Spyradosoma sp.]
METKTLLTGKFVAETLGAEWRGGNAPEEIAGAAIDTRKIAAGELFVAIRTESRDGHDFLAAARERGAAGALVSRFVPEVELPQLVVPDAVAALQRLAAEHRRRNCGNVRVFGVTGSVGKTSTKDLLARLLARAGAVLATEKNLNNTLGVPLTLLKIDPSAHDFAVIEAGMSVPGELGRSAEMIAPDVALVTNVKPAHLEGLGTMENIAREKAELPARRARDGNAFFWADLLRYESFRALGEATVLSLRENSSGRNFSGESVPVNLRERADGFEIGVLGETFFARGVSRGLAENAALAICAVADRVPAEKIREALDAWKPSANRGEVRERADGGGSVFVDCYNASPASMLDSARAFAKRFPAAAGTPRLFVLGGMGELGADSERLHREVGEALPLDASTDVLALFGGNAPRIGEGAVARGFPQERVRVFSDIETLRACVAAFRGNAMIKGSRAFALERALPPTR